MLRDTFVILEKLDRAAGGGVGLSALCAETGKSKYLIRKVLKEMLAMGMIMRKANLYYLCNFGACLRVADCAASEGYGVAYTECEDYMPAFQKGF